MTKKELLNKLRRLQKGLPTDLVYFNRTIDKKYVQAPNDYNVATIDEFLEKDIQSVLSLGGSIIRPILGMFGSGKTTVLNRIELILPRIVSIDKYFLIRINLENVPVVQHHEFIGAIMKQIFPIMETEQFKNMYQVCEEEELSKIFQGIEILENIKNLYSTSQRERISSRAYFYDKIEEEKIFQVVEGLIKLAKKNGKIIIILVDELESLITLDKDGILTEIIVSRFLRGIIDRHDTSVYIAFTCYREAYDSLKENFFKFYRIVEGNEIKLGDISDKEKKELTKKILDETMEFTFGKLSVDNILIKFKGTLDFFIGNIVKFVVNEIFQYIDQSKEIWEKIQNLYEDNARQQIAIPQLLKWNFKRANISDKVKNIAGYNFDIFASETNRNKIVKRVFGEIKSVTCNKGWAEKFISWINIQIYTHSGEFVRNRDKLLFIAPAYTSDALKLLEGFGVECIKYHDVSVDSLIEDIEKQKIKGLSDEEREIIKFIKETKGKCRSYNVMINNFSKKLLENLVRKGKIVVKTTKSSKRFCLKI